MPLVLLSAPLASQYDEVLDNGSRKRLEGENSSWSGAVLEYWNDGYSETVIERFVHFRSVAS